MTIAAFVIPRHCHSTPLSFRGTRNLLSTKQDPSFRRDDNRNLCHSEALSFRGTRNISSPNKIPPIVGMTIANFVIPRHCHSEVRGISYLPNKIPPFVGMTIAIFVIPPPCHSEVRGISHLPNKIPPFVGMTIAPFVISRQCHSEARGISLIYHNKKSLHFIVQKFPIWIYILYQFNFL
jgi:hypothetical protein